MAPHSTKMHPNGAAHHGQHHSLRERVLEREIKLLRSLGNSFKEGKKEVQEASKTAYNVLHFISACLMFPILEPWRFVCLVRNLFVVGWQKGFSSSMLSVLREIDAPLKDFGVWVEKKAFECFGGYDLMVGPDRQLSIIGVLDKNVQLQAQTVDHFPSPTPSARPNADVCVMAAKIVYESEEVVTDVINKVWNTLVVEGGRVKGRSTPPEKFEFIKWFPYEKKDADHSVETQAMLFKKGHAYVVAFRGTEPFSAVDWATDFYFPWYDEFPALGRVHSGFLQSLGLGYPVNTNPPMGQRKGREAKAEKQTQAAEARIEDAKRAKQAEHDKLDEFVDYIELCMTRFNTAAERSTLLPEEREQSRKAEEERSAALMAMREQFEEKYMRASAGSEEVKRDAPLYWQIRNKLEQIVKDDKEATIFITGHSLGGALAALFTGLIAAENDNIAQHIGALYTFGQPRVGDWTFAWFLHNRMNVPQHRYIRMVYNNDLVPHVPFDSDVFEFKHLGPFHRADALYHVRIGTFDDQPRINFPIAHATAIFELWYNVVWNAFANRVFRPPKFQRPTESFPQVMARLSSIFMPVIGAHSPVNYVNAVRHGMPEGKTKRAPAIVA